MEQVALSIPQSGCSGITHVVEGRFEPIKATSPSREVVVLGLAIALLQICDGFLTLSGIYAFGIEAEGNAFLRFLMAQIGPEAALIITKAAAVVVTGWLCRLSTSVGWVRHALKGIVAVYLTAAVIPWSLILISGV